MSVAEGFSEKFQELLGKISDKTSLEERQYLYREVIYKMGLKILEDFPEAVVGPDPDRKGGGADGRSGGDGSSASAIIATFNGIARGASHNGGSGGGPHLVLGIGLLALLLEEDTRKRRRPRR